MRVWKWIVCLFSCVEVDSVCMEVDSVCVEVDGVCVWKWIMCVCGSEYFVCV